MSKSKPSIRAWYNIGLGYQFNLQPQDLEWKHVASTCICKGYFVTVRLEGWWMSDWWEPCKTNLLCPYWYDFMCVCECVVCMHIHTHTSCNRRVNKKIVCREYKWEELQASLSSVPCYVWQPHHPAPFRRTYTTPCVGTWVIREALSGVRRSDLKARNYWYLILVPT